jgi:AraC-like DNA-binding protein
VIPQVERAARSGPRASTDGAHLLAVERAVCVIRSRFAEPDTLHRLSDAAWLSRFHLHRVFSEVTGVSPGRFLAAVRLEAAKRMLLDSRLRVMDICYEVGYESVGRFTSQFTSLVGTQPRRFRQLVQAFRDRRIELPPLAAADDSRAPVRLCGTIGCEDGFSGWACLGLFPSRVPQGTPAACTLAAAPGRFSIAAAASIGSQHLLAVAMPPPDRMIDLLVPDQSRLRVGWIQPHRQAGQCHVELRTLRLTDPPVVLAYPLLLAQRVPSSLVSI